MADLLTLFHDSVALGREVVLDDNTLVFDLGNGRTRREAISTVTPFVAKKTAVAATLEDIYWVYVHREQRWALYFQATVGRPRPSFVLNDFKQLVDFFVSGNLQALLPNAPPSLAPSSSQPQQQVIVSSEADGDGSFGSEPLRIPRTPPLRDAKRRDRTSASQSASASQSSSSSSSSSQSSSSSSQPFSSSKSSSSSTSRMREIQVKKARIHIKDPSVPDVDEQLFSRPPVPTSPGTSELLNTQRQLHSLKSVLECSKNFEVVGELALATMEVIKRSSSSASSASSASSLSSTGSGSGIGIPRSIKSMGGETSGGSNARGGTKSAVGSGGKTSTGLPIIVVPPTGSLFSLQNVKRFLEEGQYEDLQAVKVSSNAKDGILVERPRSKAMLEGAPAKYRVVDNVTALRPDDWKRVAAVFVMGPQWQFQAFPEAFRSPVYLFSHVCGFHFHWSTDKPHANVGNWNVISLTIPKEVKNRHLTAQSHLDFWQTLERFVLIQRSKGAPY